MGLTGATAEGLKTTFNNLGLGSLATTLGLDEALKAAQEKADELLNNKEVNMSYLPDGVEKQIQSEFYIPQQLIDFPILKDMFFNNNLFKKFINTAR